MSFSQAKYLWSSHVTGLSKSQEITQSLHYAIICCIPRLAGDIPCLSWLPGCQPGIQPRPNSWASVCRLAGAAPKETQSGGQATDSYGIQAYACCNMLQLSPMFELNSLTRFACVLHIQYLCTQNVLIFCIRTQSTSTNAVGELHRIASLGIP